MLSQLDREYSPSEFSKRFATVEEVVPNHYATIKSHSKAQRDRVPPKLFAYGPSSAELLDLYVAADSPADAPICVYIHGGYWQAGCREDHGFVATQLSASGCRVFVVGYELCPSVTLADVVQQIVRAARFIGDYGNKLGSKHITYIGHSAGAHLIVCMLQNLLQSADNAAYLPGIQHIFLVSGVYDLHELRTTEAVNPANILGLNDHNTAELSPQQNLAKLGSLLGAVAAPSALCFHVVVGEHESPTFRRHSAEYTFGLQQAGIKCDFKLMAGCDHFDIVERLVESDYQLTVDVVEATTA